MKSMYIMNIFLQKLNWITLYKLYNRLLSLLICSFCIVVQVWNCKPALDIGKNQSWNVWSRISHACATFNRLPKDYSEAVWSLLSSKQAWQEALSSFTVKLICPYWVQQTPSFVSLWIKLIVFWRLSLSLRIFKYSFGVQLQVCIF